MFYIGCPMWGYKEWVGEFFPPRTPQGEFLRLYSQRLTTVEGNTTFYATPNIETVARWRMDTPSSFRFCFKIPRSISHEPGLDTAKSELMAFLERMRALQERLGPMFLQLPPSFGPSELPRLEAFLNFWPSDVRLAVEVRHPEFYEDQHASTLNSLLSQHQVARVMMDTRPIRIGPAKEQAVLQARERKPDLPLQVAITSDFTFVRYIGNPHMDANEPFFTEWSQRFAQWLQQGMTLYVFCHCPFEVHSPSICRALYQRVRQLTALPPLPWESELHDEDVEQGRLF